MPNRKEQVAERKAGKGGQPMNTTYQTLIVKFSEPIAALDGIFDDAQAWGTDTLKGWIDDYESTRFTATDSHTRRGSNGRPLLPRCENFERVGGVGIANA